MTLLGALALTLLSSLLYLRFEQGWTLSSLEAQTTDSRFRLRGPIEPGPDIVLVLIDEASIAEEDRWPISRASLAQTINRLSAAGAKLIVLDLLLVESEKNLSAEARRALSAIESLLPPGSSERGSVQQLLAADGPDENLARAMARNMHTLLPFAFALGGARANEVSAPASLREAILPLVRRPQDYRSSVDEKVSGLLLPNAELLARAAGSGHINIVLEPDGGLRRGHPVIGYGGAYYPSLPLAAAMRFAALGNDQVVVNLGEDLVLEDRSIPLDRESRLTINHYGPSGRFPSFSFRDVKAGEIDPAALAGKLVIISAAPSGAGDKFSTPFTSQLSGAELVATITDNLLTGRSLTEDAQTGLLSFLAMMVIGLAAALIADRASFRYALVLFLALIALWAGLAQYLFATQGWLVNVSGVIAIAFLNFLVFQVVRLRREQKGRREMERQRSNLARYFSPVVAEHLARSKRQLDLDREQDVAVAFVDIVGFTRHAEKLSPPEIMATLRNFHRILEASVFRHHGVVNKLLGDGALACFGIPRGTAQDAANALAFSLDFVACIEAWNDENKAAGRPAIRVAIGLHYGPAMLGDLGGDQQFEFTLVGDTLNVASRLEGLTRHLDVVVLASDALVERVRNTDGDSTPLLAGFKAFPNVQLRGRDDTVDLWGLQHAPRTQQGQLGEQVEAHP